MKPMVSFCCGCCAGGGAGRAGGVSCASVVLAAPAMSAEAMIAGNTCRSLLPSPLWGGVGGGGSCWAFRKTELPPSLTLPHEGGGNAPSLLGLLSIKFLRIRLLIDHHAPGDTAYGYGDQRLLALHVHHRDVVAEAVGDV